MVGFRLACGFETSPKGLPTPQKEAPRAGDLSIGTAPCFVGHPCVGRTSYRPPMGANALRHLAAPTSQRQHAEGGRKMDPKR